MGFFDSVIEQTIDLLKRDGELSSCRILKGPSRLAFISRPFPK